MSASKYSDVIVEIKDKIGIIKFNRPKVLNSFGGNLYGDTIAALRELNEHPDTIITVLTGEGRFFSAGADVKSWGSAGGEIPSFANAAEKKLFYMSRFAAAGELMRSMIQHRKVFVVALNGPAVGGGAAWFACVADIVLAATESWLHVTFSSLGLVPENGAAVHYMQTMGPQRANELLLLGRKVDAEELKEWGLVNRVFPKEGFLGHVVAYLEECVAVNDGASMMESKRLMNAPLRDKRLLAVYDAVDALAERFVIDAPAERFAAKRMELEEKSKTKTSKI